MKAIHVLRKPGSEPTVAANVLRHGCGAINVDGCRVDGTPGDGRWGKGVQTPDRHPFSSGVKPYIPIDKTSGGRWPANVVFQHLDGCVQDGTRQVKGSAPASGPTLNGRSTSVSRGVFNGVDQTPCYTDPHTGTETVPAWDCAEGCPVANLDAQSGTSSGVVRKPTGKPIYPTEGGSMIWNSNSVVDTSERGFADTGGASRFFKQFTTPSGCKP
jgi:site-specific DNA-methyltransferase (adenine-specific)